MIERLLSAHFVRRFLDNDLISPDADRHEMLSAASAALIAGGLFVTVLMGFKYLTQPFQSPARTAIPAIDDRFFLFGTSMGVMALVALAGWNALSLDARDIAILGPLPIARRTIVRAKLGSVAIVAAAFALALNAVTSVLYPILLVAKLPVGFIPTGELVLAHVTVSLAAGVFGFMAVLAAREILHVAIGTGRFTHVSVPVHACLAVAVIAALLLLPGMSSNVARTWLVDPSAPRWSVPPLWFVGLHEYLVGDLMIRLPHGELPRFVMGVENRMAALYALSRPAFAGLGSMAAAALVTVGAAGLPAYWWNNRRIDGAPPAVAALGRSRARRAVAHIADIVVVRHPVARAGFWFAYQCLARSLPHRLSMATSVAVGIAAVMVALPFGSGAAATPPIPLGFFAPQVIALCSVVLGLRHAVGLPADLRANWLFGVAWLGDARHYTAGVRRFALVGLIAPTASLLVPVHAMSLGPWRAVAQALLGSLVAAILLQALMIGFERLPFAAPHAPSGTLKTRGPVYLFGGIAAVYGVAWLERAALERPAGFAAFTAIAVAIYASLAWLARRHGRSKVSIDFEEPPQEGTQRLGLTG